MEIEKITKLIGVITGCFALIGGGYTAVDKVKNSFKNTQIIMWHPEYFSVSDGVASGEFRAVVARQKYRDDCSVESFKIEVKDSDYIVHEASPSLSVFSGPATPTIDKFGFKFTIKNHQNVAKGTAVLLGHITYKCPEGIVLVNYPNHKNLTFDIN